MAIAQKILDDAEIQAKKLVKKNGYSADYDAQLGVTELKTGENCARALSLLIFEEIKKQDSREGSSLPAFKAEKSVNRIVFTVEVAAWVGDSKPGSVAMQMWADIKSCFLTNPWTTYLKIFSYQGASWSPPEGDILTVQIRFECEYFEKYADILTN